MSIALAFPGQGSQAIGMGKEFYDNFLEAKEIFQEVDESLKQNLSQLIFSGDINELTLTANTQPALMTVSMAMMAVLEKNFKYDIVKNVKLAFGHSLGEYTALTAVKSFNVQQTAKLLRIRGNAMQEAAPKGTSGMVALLGCDIAMAEKLVIEAREGEVCEIANDNAEGQIVASGHLSAMERLIAMAAENGKRAVKLPVSAAFHSSLMLKAQEIMEKALANEQVNVPIVPIIANYTANITSDPAQIKDLLVKQVSGRVRFRESVLNAENMGITEVYEIGAGKVLSGIIKRVSSVIQPKSINTIADLEALAK